MNRATQANRSVAVFDLDGTLVDTAEDIAFSVNHLRLKQGLIALKTEEILKAVGRGAPFLLQKMLEIANDDQSLTDYWLNAFQTHYLKHQGERSVLYPGIVRALEELSDIADLYVLSNKPHAATLCELQKKGIHTVFKKVWGAGQFPALKPDPVGILSACQISRVSVANAVMVGDLWIDIQAGFNAGVHTIYVDWGFGQHAPKEPAPSKTISSPDLLFNTICQLVS